MQVHSWGKNTFIAVEALRSGGAVHDDTVVIAAEIASVKEVSHEVMSLGEIDGGKQRFIWKV